MKDFTDLAEGTAWAVGIFILLGVFFHGFFLICALAASGFFVFLTWYDLRQRARLPDYQYLTDEKGDVVGIHCNRCGRSSRKQDDIESAACSFCLGTSKINEARRAQPRRS